MNVGESRPNKRKRVNKNKKKNWRKHVDITDVEEFLEDTRLEERTGGAASEKTDGELFIVESNPLAAAKLSPSKKGRYDVKKLKCFSNLEPDIRIRPARIKHNIRENSLKKRCTQIQNKIRDGILSQSEKQSLKDSKMAELKKKQLQKTRFSMRQASFDLWGKEESFLDPEDFATKIPPKMRKKPPHNYGKKPNGASSVEVPHPGASYNPTFEDHQELLAFALEKEVAKEIEEKKVHRSLDAKFPAHADTPNQHTWLSEMSVGLLPEDDSAESGTEGDLDQISYNPPVRRENKKTERQRRKESKRKEQEKSLKDQKDLNIKTKQLHRLKTIKKEVHAVEKKHMERKSLRNAKKDASKDQPKKLGKKKYEEPNVEIKLSTEIEGSLRLLKPEGHLMEDRFKSFQKRNIIEPRERAKFKRRYKIKKYEKRGHRDVTL